MEEIKYLLALSYLPQLGEVTVKKLIRNFGSPQAVWNLKKADLEQFQNVSDRLYKLLENNDKYLALAEKELEYIHKNNFNATSYLSKEYPTLLKNCIDGPTVLFSNGNLDFHSGKFVAIVGTRRMTSLGKEFIHNLINDLQGQPITIVSGLAVGVDIEAHKSAIENNLQTIAVLASELGNITPKQNENIAKNMMKNGGIVSEFSSWHKPEPHYFLKRNRIIAGLCEVTIVVESDIGGGSMNTANFANQYNRDVFAVPGRVKDNVKSGCHHLIKNHQAYMITEAKDLLNHLNLGTEPKKSVQKELFIELNEEEKKIFQFIHKNGKKHVDELSKLMDLTSYQLLPILLGLEMKGLILTKPGKFYELA